MIQESSEPFPITRGYLLGGQYTKSPKDNVEDTKKSLKRSSTPDSNIVGMSAKGEQLAKCEACGTVDVRAKFKKGKRFCSLQCSKKMREEKRMKCDIKDELMETESADSGAESNICPTESAQNTCEPEANAEPRVDPLKWGVQEVFEFIKNLPGCSDYAEDFLIQEIDGQALMLLKEDHLMTAMAMKLGPALKIVAKIDDMRVDKEPPKPPS